MTPITAVISDLGGVLTTPLLPAFAALQKEWEIEPSALGHAFAEAARRHGGHPLVEMETGRLSEADFLDQLGTALREHVGREVPIHDMAARLWSQLGVNDELLAELHAHRAAGMRMAMLTNNVREWETRWRSLFDVDALFELVVDSAFVGMRKPDPEIYALTLERLGLPAQSCVFIDDIDINVTAAREQGLHAIHFLTTEQTIAELRALIGDPAVQ